MRRSIQQAIGNVNNKVLDSEIIRHHNAAMLLGDYLTKHNLTIRDFADQLGVTHEAVRLWKTGQRIPRRDQMDAIKRATAGKVMPNDFFTQPDGEAAA